MRFFKVVYKILTLWLPLCLLGNITLMGSAWGQSCPEKSLSQKIFDCRNHMNRAIKDALARDKGLINAHLSHLSLKLANYILSQNEQNQTISIDRPLSALFETLLQTQNLSELDQDDENLYKDIHRLYRESYRQNVLSSSSLDDLEIEAFESADDLKDIQLVDMFSKLKPDHPLSKVINEHDRSILWFADLAYKKTFNKPSAFIAEGLSRFLEQAMKYSGAERKNYLKKTLAQANLKRIATLNAIKQKTFFRHKCDCLYDYKFQVNAQNQSIYDVCVEKNIEMLKDDFTNAIHQVLKNTDQEIAIHQNLSLAVSKRELESPQVRRLQDYYNKEGASNKERVIGFYKSGLYQDKDNCQTFTMIDKKRQKIGLYTTKGELIFEAPAIVARPRLGTNQVIFNPDGELRQFNDDSYTRTTSAGVFYSSLDIPKAQRDARKYSDEFNDRVFVLSTKTQSDNGDVFDDKITIALHGVPVNGYVANANTRLRSFDGGNRRLSTGCVNIEAYTFDMINEMSQNHCPVYILPEDPYNYFYIKNREIVYSTKKSERKEGVEVPKRCNGQARLASNGKVECDGSWTQDPNGNINRYYYSKLSRNYRVKAIKAEGDADISKVKSLFDQRKSLIEETTNGQIDEEDFLDLLALTHAVSKEQSNFKSLETFKDLYNAYYTLRETSSFDRLTIKEKRKRILEYYLNPAGFESTRESTYAPINRNFTVTEYLEKSKELAFKY